MGIRDEKDIRQVEENLRRALENKPDFGMKQPQQEQFELDEQAPPETPPNLLRLKPLTPNPLIEQSQHQQKLPRCSSRY